MKKYGFTLIELQAVIILLGIIVAISVPSIVSHLKKSETQIREMITTTIYEAAESKILDNPKDYRLINGKIFCMTIQSLIDDGIISESIFKGSVGDEFVLTDSIEATVDAFSNLSFEIKTTCVEN